MLHTYYCTSSLIEWKLKETTFSSGCDYFEHLVRLKDFSSTTTKEVPRLPVSREHGSTAETTQHLSLKDRTVSPMLVECDLWACSEKKKT